MIQLKKTIQGNHCMSTAAHKGKDKLVPAGYFDHEMLHNLLDGFFLSAPVYVMHVAQLNFLATLIKQICPPWRHILPDDIDNEAASHCITLPSYFLAHYLLYKCNFNVHSGETNWCHAQRMFRNDRNSVNKPWSHEMWIWSSLQQYKSPEMRAPAWYIQLITFYFDITHLFRFYFSSGMFTIFNCSFLFLSHGTVCGTRLAPL